MLIMMINMVKMFMMMIIVKVFMKLIMVKMFMKMIMVKMFMKITLCGAAHHLRVSHIVSRCFHCGRRAPKPIFYLSYVIKWHLSKRSIVSLPIMDKALFCYLPPPDNG